MLRHCSFRKRYPVIQRSYGQNYADIMQRGGRSLSGFLRFGRENKMTINLQIVRHGKTEAVPKSIYCGYSDLPLSEEGINEIKEFI